MTIQQLEQLNDAKLPKRYHQVAESIPSEVYEELAIAWETGDKDLYHRVLKQYKDTREEYYILGIWFHPLTGIQQRVKQLT